FTRGDVHRGHRGLAGRVRAGKERVLVSVRRRHVKIPRQSAATTTRQVALTSARQCPEIDLPPPDALLKYPWHRRNPSDRPAYAALVNEIRFTREKGANGRYKYLGFNLDAGGSIASRYDGTYAVKSSQYNDGYAVDFENARVYPRLLTGYVPPILDMGTSLY